MDKIAIVVQRYGKEINGGAEVHASLLALHLKKKYEVEIVTSCSLGFPVWDNHYPAGEEMIDGIRVLRFAHKRDPNTPRWLGRYLNSNWKYYHTKYKLGNFISLSIRRIRYMRRKNHDEIFERWIENDSLVCPELISYIEQEKDQYKAFIFFTYQFYPTYFGLQKTIGKNIFIPTAHDEPMLYLSGYTKMFASSQFIMYNTESEKQLVESAHPVTRSINSDIAGVGIDTLSLSEDTVPPINSPYLVYIGRIDVGKGCVELINYFSRMNRSLQKPIKLVMIGKNNLKNEIKNEEDVVFTGFISEEEKVAYLQYCEALVIPSRYESLSLVTLEAMSAGKPVLANGHCEVLKDHIDKSSAGFAYYSEKDFNEQINKILSLSDQERQIIAENGKSYVDVNYRWSAVVKKFDAAIGMMRQSG